MFDLSPLLLPFFPHNYENVWQKKGKKNKNEEKYLSGISLPWSLDILERGNLFGLSHCKT
jgi:hypothetical protein